MAFRMRLTSYKCSLHSCEFCPADGSLGLNTDLVKSNIWIDPVVCFLKWVELRTKGQEC